MKLILTSFSNSSNFIKCSWLKCCLNDCRVFENILSTIFSSFLLKLTLFYNNYTKHKYQYAGCKSKVKTVIFRAVSLFNVGECILFYPRIMISGILPFDLSFLRSTITIKVSRSSLSKHRRKKDAPLDVDDVISRIYSLKNAIQLVSIEKIK